MEGLGELICKKCNMAFHSVELLDKHKTKFCIGIDLKEPVSLRRVQMGRIEPAKASVKTMHPTRAKTPDLIILKEQRNQPVAQRKNLQDKPQDGMSENNSLIKFTEEFQKLRMSVEKSLPRSQTEVPQRGTEEQRSHQLFKYHEQRLAEIREHSHQLEREREEIKQQLAELAGRDRTVHLEEALHELRYQEQRNEEMLHQLSSHISSIKRPNPNEVSSNPPEDKKTQHISFNLISVDGPLSAQIRALHLAYMQSGGSDPDVLANMHDLQAEALTLEQTRPKADGRTKVKRMQSPHKLFDPVVLAVEQENQRLEEEIFRIQLARDRHKGEHGLSVMQKDHVHQMASLQAEIAHLRREIEKGRERMPAPTPPTSPIFPGPSLALKHPALPLDQSSKQPQIMYPHVTAPVETLGPALYDPVDGLVIFYDLVMGVEATLSSVRLLAGLYCNGQKLGQTTPMPPVQCLPAGELHYPSTSSPGNYAILAVKQPVPGIQASPNLSLVMEIQAPGGLGLYNHNVGGMVSLGWAKLELFDQHNQVHSGYWRLPFRSLPVRVSLSPAQLNSVPQLGNMELCVRVINACDGDVQTLAKIDPSNISHYKYPPMASNTPTMLTTHELKHKLQPSSSLVPSSLPQMDQVFSLRVQLEADIIG